MHFYHSLLPVAKLTKFKNEIDVIERHAKPSILFFTAIFSDNSQSMSDELRNQSFLRSTNNNYLLSYLKSMGGCPNANFLLISNTHILPHERGLLPSNVQHVYITWNALVARLADFLGLPPHSLKALAKSKGFYKVCDMKPLIPLLYPEVMTSHKWFGWMDNDAWMSHRFVTAMVKTLTDTGVDQLSHLNTEVESWGPLSAYRLSSYWKYVLPEIQRVRNELFEVFYNPKIQSWTEWGVPGKGNISFSKVLKNVVQKYPNYRSAGFDRDFNGTFLLWDYNCFLRNQTEDPFDLNAFLRIPLNSTCGHCRMTWEGGGKRTILQTYAGEHVGFKHFQFTKYMHWAHLIDRKNRNLTATNNEYGVTMKNFHNIGNAAVVSSFRRGINIGD